MPTRLESLRVLVTAIIFVSFNLSFAGLAVGNDIVATEDVVAGSSVFVFRGSRNRPQGGGGSAPKSGALRSSYRAKVNGQVANSREKKLAQAKARQEALAKARQRERLARLRLSNTLADSGEKKLAAGDIDGAITDFRGSLNANLKNTEAAHGLSDALSLKGIQAMENGQTAPAIEFFNEAVKRNPKNEIAFLKLAEVHDSDGRKDLAAANYEKALAIDPELTALYLPAALAFGETGDQAKAEMYLLKAEAADPGSAEIQLARAQLYLDQKKDKEALAVLDRIEEANRGNADFHLMKGSALARIGQNAKAIDAFKRSAQLNPSLAGAWVELGHLYYNSGDFRNALTAYHSAVRVDAGNARFRYFLASTYRQLERYQEANVEYALAAQTIKDDPNLYSEWGYCLGKAAEWDRSSERLETARQLDPGAIGETNVGWAYYNGAQADKAAKRERESEEKLAKARTSLESAVNKDPNLDAAHLNLGSTYNSMGEHRMAIAALNEAVRLNNDWVIALNQLGLAYRGANNLDLALNTFNRAVVIDRNNVPGLFYLGSTQYAAGDKKGAQQTQARLKKIRPDLADQLGNIIAGKAIEFGTQKLKQKIRIPGIPF